MSKKLTTEEFIEKAKKVHGDKYDYSLVDYKCNKEKVCIICPIHGEFWQMPRYHLEGSGCKKCSNDKLSSTTEEFIEKAKKAHGDKYDYSKVEYKNIDTKVCIICPLHGEFWQTPYKHTNTKQGCPLCGKIRVAEYNRSQALTKKEFIEKAKKIHGNDYDYSEVEYVNYDTKVKIKCKKCGNFFWQSPNNHLSKANYGCGKCYNSKLERDTEKILKENNINYETQKRFDDCCDKRALPFDFYLPNLNIAIECQGIQHFELRSAFFRNKKDFDTLQNHDNIKRNFCKKNGIKEIEILYNQNPLTVLKENSIIK